MRTHLRDIPRGLGDAADVTQAAGAANSLINATGAKPSSGVTQTQAGKTAQSVEQISSKVEQLGKQIPQPYGGIVMAVAAVIGVAAKVVDDIWGTNPDKATLAQAGQVNQLNSVLRNQILQVNQQISSVSAGMQQLQTALQQGGFSGPHRKGLGDAADNVLANAYASNAQLQTALDQKVAALTSLINNFNTAVTDTYNAINSKSTGQKIVLLGFIGLAIAGLAWFVIQLPDKK